MCTYAAVTSVCVPQMFIAIQTKGGVFGSWCSLGKQTHSSFPPFPNVRTEHTRRGSVSHLRPRKWTLNRQLNLEVLILQNWEKEMFIDDPVMLHLVVGTQTDVCRTTMETENPLCLLFLFITCSLAQAKTLYKFKQGVLSLYFFVYLLYCLVYQKFIL